jgi:hypothetical protein
VLYSRCPFAMFDAVLKFLVWNNFLVKPSVRRTNQFFFLCSKYQTVYKLTLILCHQFTVFVWQPALLSNFFYGRCQRTVLNKYTISTNQSLLFCFSLFLYFRCLNFKMVSGHAFEPPTSTGNKLLLFVICYLSLCHNILNFLSFSSCRNNYKMLIIFVPTQIRF